MRTPRQTYRSQRCLRRDSAGSRARWRKAHLAFVPFLNFIGATAFGALHRSAERKPQLQFMLETFVSLGQATQDSQSRRQMLHCFARRTAAQRVARGLFAIPQCPLEIAAPLEMARQLRRYLVCIFSVRRFLAHTDAIVQSRTARRRQPCVNSFAIQCVPKAEARGDGAIGPFVVAHVLQKRHFAAQCGAPFLDVGQGRIGAGPQPPPLKTPREMTSIAVTRLLGFQQSDSISGRSF